MMDPMMIGKDFSSTMQDGVLAFLHSMIFSGFSKSYSYSVDISFPAFDGMYFSQHWVWHCDASIHFYPIGSKSILKGLSFEVESILGQFPFAGAPGAIATGLLDFMYGSYTLAGVLGLEADAGFESSFFAVGVDLSSFLAVALLSSYYFGVLSSYLASSFAVSLAGVLSPPVDVESFAAVAVSSFFVVSSVDFGSALATVLVVQSAFKPKSSVQSPDLSVVPIADPFELTAHLNA